MILWHSSKCGAETLWLCLYELILLMLEDILWIPKLFYPLHVMMIFLSLLKKSNALLLRSEA